MAKSDAEATLKVTFDGSQGTPLAAALDRADAPRPTYAIFAHCFSCSKDIKAAREIARALRARGYSVLRFDFTGLGGSEGEFANTNFSSNVEDLVAAADFLRREHGAPSLLIGHSLGGAAVLVAAMQLPDVKGVVTIGAPSEAAHVELQLGSAGAAIERDGEAQVQLAGRPFTIRRQFLEDIRGARVREAAAALKRPLLILHAPHDATVGVGNAAELFTAAKHPKSFISLDTADHLLSDPADARYAAEAIAAWASRFVPQARARGEMVATSTPAALPAFRGGARVASRPGEPLAVDASIDGHPFVFDAGVGEGGSGLGPNPTRTLEAALAACAAITVRMYAARKGWPLEAVDVEVTRAEGADAHVARRLVKTVRLTGPLDDAQRNRLLEIADKCPVHRMLAGGVEIASRLA